MLDGMIETPLRIDPFARDAMITTIESAKEFFDLYDPTKVKRIFIVDLDKLCIGRVRNLQEAVEFYNDN